MSYTEWLKTQRFTVVAVDAPSGLLRVKGHGDVCRDLSCPEQSQVVGEDGRPGGLEGLNPGDIVKLDSTDGQATQVVVLRRVWDELTSPEF